MTDIFAKDRPRFTVFTEEDGEEWGFVWDEKNKCFVSDWVEFNGRDGAWRPKRIPLRKVIEYTTEKRQEEEEK